MKTQLIKTKDKYKLVSNEEIKDNDKCNYRDEIITAKYIDKNSDGFIGKPTNDYYPKRMTKKIISENPDFSDLKEEDCKEIGYVDVEKLADTYLRNHNKFNRIDYGLNLQSYKDGFKTAQSINDKVFSLEDMRKAYREGTTVNAGTSKHFEEIIQSLQKTEWDVEVETEYQDMHGMWFTKPTILSELDRPSRPKITNDKIKVTKIL